MLLLCDIIQYLFIAYTVSIEEYDLGKYINRLGLIHSHEQSLLALEKRVEMRLFEF